MAPPSLADSAPHAAPAQVPSPMTAWQAWGMILIAPYVLIFLVFVVFPVGYGFWLARNPHNYVELFDDPIFLRSVGNTLVFLIVGINIKMALALMISGFFIHTRWWIKTLMVLFILPSAVPSTPPILSMTFILN